jgi:hypothetical protein
MLSKIFGELRWSPPLWVRRVPAAIHALAQNLRANPRRNIGILAVALCVGLGSVLAWRWYQSRPQPVEYQVSIIEMPERTCIECDPPGKPDAVLIGFDGSVAPLEQAGKTIDPAKSGVSIQPAIAGTWTWEDDHTLSFRPNQDWPLGKTFTVQFARKGFVAPQARLSRYSVVFTAPAFSASIANNEFYQDPIIAANKKVVTTLEFTQPVDVKTLESRIRVKLFQKVTDSREQEVSPAPTYTLTYDKLRLHAYLHTSSLTVLPKGTVKSL